MPLVFRWNGLRFHFYSNEGDPREPLHIHVNRGEADAKFWLYPTVERVYSHGLTARELRQDTEEIERRSDEIERAWNEHFG